MAQNYNHTPIDLCQQIQHVCFSSDSTAIACDSFADIVRCQLKCSPHWARRTSLFPSTDTKGRDWRWGAGVIRRCLGGSLTLSVSDSGDPFCPLPQKSIPSELPPAQTRFRSDLSGKSAGWPAGHWLSS